MTVGQVKFCDTITAYCNDVHLLGLAQLTSAGTATIKLRPGIGTYTYKADFVGTSSYAHSVSNSGLLAVSGKSPTVTVIAESGTSSDYALTAIVSSSGKNAITSGVPFLDESDGYASLGTGPISLTTSGVGFSRSSYDSSQMPTSGIAVGDFNGDGIPDIASAEVLSDAISVLLSDGSGAFTPLGPTGGYGGIGQYGAFLVTADFNGDGIPDLAVTNAGSSLSINLGNGDGTFRQANTIDTISDPYWLATGDFNGDGIMDLVVAGNGDGSSGESDPMMVLLGDGSGGFSPVSGSPVTGFTVGSVGVGDFNGDGVPDLAVENSQAGTTLILLGNGDGTFASFGEPIGAGKNEGPILVADFNSDGKLDFAVPTTNNALLVYLGSGKGTFQVVAKQPPTGKNPLSLTTGDFNGDGIADIAMANDFGLNVTVLLGKGDGTFTPAPTSPTTCSNPMYISSADFNGDGVSDLAVGVGSCQTVTVFLTSEETATATLTGVSFPSGSGLHSVEASYPGDSNHLPSVSGTVLLGTEVPTATPVFTPGAGSYASAQTVTITDSTPGAVIYYALHGVTPTPSSTKYTGPISVTGSETIKAIALAPNFTTSAVASALFTIK